MKKLSSIVLLISLSISVASQGYLDIKEMQVLEYSSELNEYSVVQDWLPYKAFLLFRGDKMFVGNDTIESNWVNHTQKIAPVEKLESDYRRETSAWIIDGKGIECMVDIKYYNDGSMVVDYLVDMYVFRYKCVVAN